ncbi:MAG TPA: TonB-dependent receptor [Gemmatimonadaceae bacterium]
MLSRRRSTRITVSAIVLAVLLAPASMRAQLAVTIKGQVADSTGAALPAAVVRIVGTRLGAVGATDGSYTIANVPPGEYQVLARAPGYTADTETVNCADGGTIVHNFRLKVNVTQLSQIVVKASPRLAETKSAALDSMHSAANVKYVESGDDIRSLPSLNAAEAAERIPGVSTERDEGEGKFVQIRGTEPKLSAVSIDGVPIPGTLNGDRSVKLDDVPSDVLGAIEVSKTLSADQDASGIGGTINLVTKIPESSPRGYISGLYGLTSIDQGTAGQGSFTYGGRVGTDQKFGFLLGGSFDRNNRPIEDIEPFWGNTASGSGYYPNDFNQRYYLYDRTRYGLNADVDYRIDSKTNLYVRGLWSRFLDHGLRYLWDVASDADSTGASKIGAQGSSGRQVEERTPVENTYGFTAGITKKDFGPFALDASAFASGSSSAEANNRNTNFSYTGPDFAYQYDNSNVVTPRYSITDPALAANLLNPSNYALSSYDYSTDTTTATQVGGRVNLKLPYTLGAMPASLKIGVALNDMDKRFNQNSASYSVTGATPPTLATLSGGSTNQHYYSAVFPGGINLGPMPSNAATQSYESANPGMFTLDPGNAVGNALGNYYGHERVAAAYIMHDFDAGAWHVNAGLRFESTFEQYRGYADTLSSDFNSPTSVAGVQQVVGQHTYNDVFPSAQVRYAFDNATNLRFAVTRGIARPDYAALAPTTLGTPNSQIPGGAQFNQTVTIGNPNLHAEYAWNYDLMLEHYLDADGLVSAGVFYKDLHDVIYNQRFQNYSGPIVAYQGAAYTVPLNGPGGHLIGWEVDWEQHFPELPGALSGLGFAANWTHVNSDAVIPNGTFDSTSTGFVPSSLPPRHASLFRTSPDIGNVSGIYSYKRLYARVAWVYQGANITSYGDGSSDPVTGDTYFYAHAQVDMSLYYNIMEGTQLQLQVLNINNAVFGFFNGTPQQQYDIQREYYGRTFYLGFRKAIQ